MFNVSLVIVPAWLEAALKAGGLSIERALDLPALSRISSLDDVGFYTSINYHLFDQIPGPLAKTFRAYDFFADGRKPGECSYDRRHVKPDNKGDIISDKEFGELIRRIRSRTWNWGAVQYAEPSPKHLMAALPYTKESLDEADSTRFYLFDVFYITDDVYGVRFVKANPNRPYGEQLYQCYDRLLNFLTLHNRFEDIAATPAFREFVTMSRTQAHPLGLV